MSWEEQQEVLSRDDANIVDLRFVHTDKAEDTCRLEKNACFENPASLGKKKTPACGTNYLAWARSTYLSWDKNRVASKQNPTAWEKNLSLRKNTHAWKKPCVALKKTPACGTN